MSDGQTGGRADGHARLPVWLPWVGPFVTYIVLHALMPQDALSPALNQLVRIVLIGGLLLLISRPVIDLRAKVPLQSILVGVGVFMIWIGPDLLFPGYRQSVPFNNGIIGSPDNVADRVRLCFPISQGERNTNPNIPGPGGARNWNDPP